MSRPRRKRLQLNMLQKIAMSAKHPCQKRSPHLWLQPRLADHSKQTEQLHGMHPLLVEGFCKVCTVYSICRLGLRNQTTFSHVDLNFWKNANCFVKLKWRVKFHNFSVIYYLVEKQFCFFFFWTMWLVLLTEVSNRLYDVFCEIFQVLFSDDLWKLWWRYLVIRGRS